MQVRMFDLDGMPDANADLLEACAAKRIHFRDWAPWVRMTCRFGTWKGFVDQLNRQLGPDDGEPALSLIGSGDFHHVTLSLLQRLREPFNLLIIDKHPDWMRGIPVMHCGTWVRHALRLRNLKNVFHVGGDLDFDNAWRHLAPWRDLRAGRITVIPAHRRFTRGFWSEVPHRPLLHAGSASMADNLNGLLHGRRGELARYPLYISLDKDAMSAAEAVVNWDSGSLAFEEVLSVLDWFREAADQRLAGMDIVGDWSPVDMRWGLRTLCHWTEHPSLHVDAERARRINGRMNANLIKWAHAELIGGEKKGQN